MKSYGIPIAGTTSLEHGLGRLPCTGRCHVPQASDGDASEPVEWLFSKCAPYPAGSQFPIDAGVSTHLAGDYLRDKKVLAEFAEETGTHEKRLLSLNAAPTPTMAFRAVLDVRHEAWRSPPRIRDPPEPGHRPSNPRGVTATHARCPDRQP